MHHARAPDARAFVLEEFETFEREYQMSTIPTEAALLLALHLKYVGTSKPPCTRWLFEIAFL
uniref:Uncharacterized protein n=1 Tax=Pristionchus pacificus TaxID=54126 RepID=A0A2A6C058_PRIPA|eukprot:PDM71520.1 hypothetical protein PRIPAC_37927 [Pristionchus pacificus]